MVLSIADSDLGGFSLLLGGGGDSNGSFCQNYPFIERS